MRIIVALIVLIPFVFSNCSNKKMRQKASDEAFRAQPPVSGEAPQVNLGKYTSFTLDNGLKVIVVEDAKLPKVSMQYLIDVPPVSQSNKVGYVDVTAEWITKGTTKRSKIEIDEQIDFMGAKLTSRADGLAASCLSRYKKDMLKIMAEIIRMPKFDDQEFNKIMTRSKSALLASGSDPDYIAGNVSKVVRFGQQHPYGEIMTLNTLEAIDPMICKGYHKYYYRPNVSYLALVGDINADEARALVTEYFEDWEALNHPVTRPPLPPFPTATKLFLVDKADAPQSVIRLTYPVELKYNAKDRLSVNVMNTILGGFFNSRLNLNLREDKGFTYGVRSSINADEYIGYFSISGSFGSDVSRQVIEEMMEEIIGLRQSLVSEEELDRAKQYMMGTFARSLERPQTIAQFALNQARYGLAEDYYESYLKRLSSVTADEVRAAAIKYLRPDKASIVIVGDVNTLKASLSDMEVIKDVVLMDKDGNVIKEADYEVPKDLQARDVLSNYLINIGIDDETMLTSLLIESEGMLTDISLKSTSWFSYPQKMKQVISSDGQIMQELLYNGDNIKMTQMGQTNEISGDAAKEQSWMAYMLPEKIMIDGDYELNIEGIEPIEGLPNYKIKVTGLAAQPIFLYFDVETGFKSRMSYTVTMGNQLAEQHTDYSNYRHVEGIKFPFKTVITGQAMPAPLILNVKRILVNPQLDDQLFKD